MEVQSLGALVAVGADPRAPHEKQVVQYGGRRFSCSPEMARIFLKHARDVIERGDEELVPLLHSGGIELLFISRATPYSLQQTAGE